MQINATQIRQGMILEHEDELWRVTWCMHRTPGKGDACMQTKLKNIVTGKNADHRFRSNDRVERAELENRDMQYLYHDGDHYIFMDLTDYEQHPLSEDLVGEMGVFLSEEGTFAVQLHNGNPVGLDIPLKMEFKVDSAPPEIKKATAAASLRPVTLENGLVVNAPSFIKDGDVIRINTETKEYIERV